MNLFRRKVVLFVVVLLLASSRRGVGVVSALGPDDEGDVISYPDPHFRTWDGYHYDYHGGCDLVLISNPLLDVHIRTASLPGYSKIAAAALSVGGDVLEVREDGDYHYVDGGSPARTTTSSPSPPPPSVGSFPLTVTSTAAGGTNFEVTLNNGQYVRFTAWSSALSVRAHGHGSDFGDSVGMGGAWTSPGSDLIKRDGTSAADGADLAESWRVSAADGDPSLFAAAATTSSSSSGAVASCVDPVPHPSWAGGCLRTTDDCPPGVCLECLDPDEIVEACRGIVHPDMRKNCEFDVRTTGDRKWAGAPFYRPRPPPPVRDGRCRPAAGGEDVCGRRHGGECVRGCLESRRHRCIPDLCVGTEPRREMENRQRPPPTRTTTTTKPSAEECACRVSTAGFYHNEVLDHLQGRDDLGGRVGTLFEPSGHDDMLEAAGKFMIESLYTEEELTKDVVAALMDLINQQLRFTLNRGGIGGVDYVHYDGIGSLLHLLGGLPVDCRPSDGLESAISGVYLEARFHDALGLVDLVVDDDDSSGSDLRSLDAIVRRRVLDVYWEDETDRDIVELFESVYRASIDYWTRGGGTAMRATAAAAAAVLLLPEEEREREEVPVLSVGASSDGRRSSPTRSERPWAERRGRRPAGPSAPGSGRDLWVRRLLMYSPADVRS